MTRILLLFLVAMAFGYAARVAVDRSTIYPPAPWTCGALVDGKWFFYAPDNNRCTVALPISELQQLARNK